MYLNEDLLYPNPCLSVTGPAGSAHRRFTGAFYFVLTVGVTLTSFGEPIGTRAAGIEPRLLKR